MVGDAWISEPLAHRTPITGMDCCSGHRQREGSLDVSYWKLAKGLDRNGKYSHAPIQWLLWSPRQDGPPVRHTHAHPPLTHLLGCQCSVEGENHIHGTYDMEMYPERRRAIDSQAVSLGLRLTLPSSGRMSSSGSLNFASKDLRLIKPDPPRFSKIICFPDSQLITSMNHIC